MLTLSLGDAIIISKVDYTKYLGVVLDDRMKFYKHISQVNIQTVTNGWHFIRYRKLFKL